MNGKPWFDWYAWHIKYWGTKWNCYDCYTIIGKSYIKFVFSTAWSAPFKIYEKLTLLGYDFQVKYADENIGSNCGIVDYCSLDDSIYYTEEYELTNPVNFARRLWDKY